MRPKRPCPRINVLRFLLSFVPIFDCLKDVNEVTDHIIDCPLPNKILGCATAFEAHSLVNPSLSGGQITLFHNGPFSRVMRLFLLKLGNCGVKSSLYFLSNNQPSLDWPTSLDRDARTAAGSGGQ